MPAMTPGLSKIQPEHSATIHIGSSSETGHNLGKLRRVSARHSEGTVRVRVMGLAAPFGMVALQNGGPKSSGEVGSGSLIQKPKV